MLALSKPGLMGTEILSKEVACSTHLLSHCGGGWGRVTASLQSLTGGHIQRGGVGMSPKGDSGLPPKVDRRRAEFFISSQPLLI